MRIILQRVKNARVDVAGATVGQIGAGLLILLGIARTDQPQDADYLMEKLIHLRIFPDQAGRMNRSIMEIGGEILVVSQFTLYGDCKRGRRPSFDEAAPVERARELYEHFVNQLRSSNVMVETGVFQAEMEVYLVNHGPVTLILESKPTLPS